MELPTSWLLLFPLANLLVGLALGGCIESPSPRSETEVQDVGVNLPDSEPLNAPDSESMVGYVLPDSTGGPVVDAAPDAAEVPATIQLAVHPPNALDLGDLNLQAGAWQIVRKPAYSRSTAVFESDGSVREAPQFGTPDDVTTQAAVLLVDYPGEFELLHFGPAETARVLVDAAPEEDLFVAMTWVTELDADPNDPYGTDVDLMLRHQNGRDDWSLLGQWMCTRRNRYPEWTRVPEQNPEYYSDSRYSNVPEYISILSPQAGVEYDIAIDYPLFQSTFGGPEVIDAPSLVSVEVFVDGEAEAAVGFSRVLEGRRGVWVGTVVVDPGSGLWTFQEVDVDIGF